MKVLNLNNLIVREKNNVINEIPKDRTIIEKKLAFTKKEYITQDIKLMNFDSLIKKLNTDDELSLDEIEKIREELKSNPVSSEDLGKAMIDYIKETSWRKKT